MNVGALLRALDQHGVDWQVAGERTDGGLGYLPSDGVPTIEEQERLARAARHEARDLLAGPAYPRRHDLRAVDGRNLLTPIRNQGSCGSCVAFAACATVEGTALRETGKRLDLSEAYLFYCVAASQGRLCAGKKMGWFPKRALAAIKDHGVPDARSFLYRSGDQPCTASADWKKRAVRVRSWGRLETPADMKHWIATRGPAVGSIQVYEDFQLYAGGTYSHVAGDKLGGHAICVVGYDDDKRHWIVKNSWGTGWGEDGFGRVAYGEVGIDSGMLGVHSVRVPS
jgi:C1A family cysteine protease